MSVKNLSVTQMYSAMHGHSFHSNHGGGHSAVQAPVLPSIHSVLHRVPNTKQQVPGAVRGGVKVVKQSVQNSYNRPIKRVIPEHAKSGSSGAITPAQATAKFKRIMSDYELAEIENYKQIWFVGPTAQKIRGTKAERNFGYDNEKGRYLIVKNDHIAYRFEILQCCGKGSFGDVMQVYDHKKNEIVALKIIRNEPRFHEQAKEEVKILELLLTQDTHNRHNVIHMKEYFKFRGHLCITFEICSNDLYNELKLGRFTGFSLDRVQSIARELVQALRHLRRNRIVHCDLKPENILLKRKGGTTVKVIDFGSSCFVREQIHTYIQSRFYRAPEIILGVGPYGCPIDMWSLGCILVELYTGRPLFPGSSEKEQLMYQVEYLGFPATALLEQAERRKSFFHEPALDGSGPIGLRKTLDRRGRTRTLRPRSLQVLIGSSPEQIQFHDFIMACLKWMPEDRITPRDASRHPFVMRSSRDTPSPREETSPDQQSRRNSAPASAPPKLRRQALESERAIKQKKLRTVLSDAAMEAKAAEVQVEARPADTERRSKIFVTSKGADRKSVV